MKTIEYRNMDKSTWSDGPWKNEPDKKQWLDKATGYPCLIVRNGDGALCGYVGVPEGHRYFGVPYDDISADVHGELTFSERCSKGSEQTAICHIVEAGESDCVWWLGFDCAHGGDFCPAFIELVEQRYFGNDATYKDFEYVTAEVERLARQMAAK